MFNNKRKPIYFDFFPISDAKNSVAEMWSPTVPFTVPLTP